MHDNSFDKWKIFSPINSFLQDKKSTTYEFDLSDVMNFDSFYNTDAAYGWVSFGIAQGEAQISITYSQKTLGEVLASLGGQTSSLIGICAFIIGGYQLFSFDKSAMKRLYFEEA